MNLTAADFRSLLVNQFPARDERERIIFSCVIRQAEKIEELEMFIRENIPQSIALLAKHVAKMSAAPVTEAATAETTGEEETEDADMPPLRATTVSAAPAASPTGPTTVSNVTTPVAAQGQVVTTSVPTPIATPNGNGARA
jgi:hypothetical protein